MVTVSFMCGGVVGFVEVWLFVSCVVCIASRNQARNGHLRHGHPKTKLTLDLDTVHW